MPFENNELNKTDVSVEDVVERFSLNHATDEEVMDYLRKHKEDIVEFCLQLRDKYKADDVTPILLIAKIIEKSL